MKNKLLFPLLVAIALSMAITPGPATASVIEALQFTGTGGLSVNGTYVAPYFGTLNGVPELFVCIDDAHPVNNGDGWQAYVGSQTDLTHAYYQGPSVTQVYGEEFTLAGQMLAQWDLYQNGLPTQQSAAADQIRFLQVLAWDITNPGSQSLSSDQQAYKSSLEGQNLTSGFDSWRIDSDVAHGGQEFVHNTPEPATCLLFGIGLIGIGLVRRKKTRK